MRRLSVIFSTLLLLTTTAAVSYSQVIQFTAQESSLTIAIFEGNSYLLHTEAGKPPYFTPVTITYLKLDSTPVPLPLPPPTPLTQRATAVRDITRNVNDTFTAIKLSQVYSDTANKIRSGNPSGYVNILSVLKTETDKLLKPPANPTSWVPVRNLISGYFDALAQEGADNKSYAALCDEVASGLREVR